MFSLVIEYMYILSTEYSGSPTRCSYFSLSLTQAMRVSRDWHHTASATLLDFDFGLRIRSHPSASNWRSFFCVCYWTVSDTPFFIELGFELTMYLFFRNGNQIMSRMYFFFNMILIFLLTPQSTINIFCSFNNTNQILFALVTLFILSFFIALSILIFSFGNTITEYQSSVFYFLEPGI